MGKTMLSRRSFLGTAGVALGGVVSSRSIPRNVEMKQPDKKIRNFNPDMRYRKLGNTDIHLSVLGLGGIGLENAVGHYALDHGVNLVHMSETYNNGNAVLELAKVMKTKRDKVYIAVKDTFKDIDAHLKTLNTDYIDFFMLAIHKAVNVPLEQNLETFEKYKKQGKVRYLGLTTHNEVKACLDAGIKTGWFSVLMPALNPPGLEAADAELKSAMEKGMGVFAMKTMKGIDDASLEPAALKKILIQPAVTTVIRGFKSFEMFDNYLKAVQETLSFQEDMQLYRYTQKNRSGNCMMCGSCEQVCPGHIEISTILRCKEYYADQMEDRDTAWRVLMDIPEERRFHPACSQCRICESQCPNGIRIADHLTEAFRFFKLV